MLAQDRPCIAWRYRFVPASEDCVRSQTTPAPEAAHYVRRHAPGYLLHLVLLRLTLLTCICDPMLSRLARGHHQLRLPNAVPLLFWDHGSRSSSLLECRSIKDQQKLVWHKLSLQSETEPWSQTSESEKMRYQTSQFMSCFVASLSNAIARTLNISS